MNNAATVHPSPKVNTATIPVNAPTSSAAVRAVRETLRANGRTLTTVSVVTVEPARPEAQAAITFPGSTECFVLRVEYTKDPS